VPALKYLRRPFLAFVREILNEPAARRRKLFRREYVDNLLANLDSSY
jgi:asparagine synthase (glutamine-hydrolysing)